MGTENKFNKPRKKDKTADKQVFQEKKNVNLLLVYTIYEQKLKRLTKEEFEELLGLGKNGKVMAFKLAKEFMKAKNEPEDENFESNVGFLSYPRFLPMIALLAQRSEYKIIPALVRKLEFDRVPERFKEKFSQLLVYGFWFLGKVIANSLSENDEVNEGNLFNFVKGDLGYWWAGVKILDWNTYAHKEQNANKEQNIHTCTRFLKMDPPKYRFYTDRAIVNMGERHPLYFLSEEDWTNFYQTVTLIDHKKVSSHCRPKPSLPDLFSSIFSEDECDSDSLCSHSSMFYSPRSIESVD